jgi:hypothetical protein
VRSPSHRSANCSTGAGRRIEAECLDTSGDRRYLRAAVLASIFRTRNDIPDRDNAGDIGYVKKNLGHYIKNSDDTDLQFLEVFRAPCFADVSLSDWIARTPPAMVAQHLNLSEATIAKFPGNNPEVMPV